MSEKNLSVSDLISAHGQTLKDALPADDIVGRGCITRAVAVTLEEHRRGFVAPAHAWSSLELNITHQLTIGGKGTSLFDVTGRRLAIAINRTLATDKLSQRLSAFGEYVQATRPPVSASTVKGLDDALQRLSERITAVRLTLALPKPKPAAPVERMPVKSKRMTAMALALANAKGVNCER